MLMCLILNLIFALEGKTSVSDIFVLPVIIALVLVLPLAAILDIALLPIELIIGIIAIIKKWGVIYDNSKSR